MLEIEEAVPIYICERSDGACFHNREDCSEDCHHTHSPLHAKNKEAIDIFERFVDTFHVVVDDMGRLNCIERE